MAVAPFVGGNFEIMTPEIHSATGVRFYASAELIPTFSQSRDLGKERDPGELRSPQQPGSDIPFDPETALGQGTKVSAEFDTLVFGAAVGVALPFTFMDWELRLKPHFAWMRYRLEAEGLAVKAVCTGLRDFDIERPGSNLGVKCPNDNSLLSPLSIDEERSNSFHGIGPGLDLEVDTGRFGPLGSSLFIGGRLFRTLGDRDISFGGSSSITYNDENGAEVTDTLSAEFNTEVKRWMYRAHIGFRVHWLGGSWD